MDTATLLKLRFEYYLLINCFFCQFGEILTKVCKICTSVARGILCKLRSIYSRIWPEKQLINRLVPALWEALKLLNQYVNFDGLNTVMMLFTVILATKRPVTWLLLSHHWLASPLAFRTAGTKYSNFVKKCWFLKKLKHFQFIRVWRWKIVPNLMTS